MTSIDQDVPPALPRRRFDWRFFVDMPLASKIGMFIILVNLAVVVLGGWLAPNGETEFVGGIWMPPSAEHLFGTDQIGRDILSRIIYGARTSVLIALGATLLSFSMGILMGFSAAVMGGAVDQVFSRIVDALMAIPTLILALVVISVLGSEVYVLILVIAVLDSTRVFRLSRAIAMDVTVMEFVEAARLRGEGLWWLMRREILPNTVMPLIAEFGLRFCFAFLFVAALSFLGLGVQPPHADWGGMVKENYNGLSYGIIASLFPAGAIALLTIGVNLVVDYILARQNRSAAAFEEQEL